MPIVREPLDPKTSLWNFLAYYLRFMREKEGLSLTQWGRIIGAARSTVSNMEAGRHRLQEDHAKIIDSRFGTGRLIELLLWYARTAHDPDWFRQYSQYEMQATAIRIHHGQVIPLPLQTDDYTLAYVRAGSSKDFEAQHASRTQRKRSILDRDDPAFLWVLIDESVLVQPVGGAEVMRAQLKHLREMADLPHIILRIVPIAVGAHLGTDGPFQVLSLDSRDIAYAGAQIGGRLIVVPSEVRELATTFDRIGAKAASEDGSRTLIEEYLERCT